jgi:glycine cleavage system pyridoxal-binding protein P
MSVDFKNRHIGLSPQDCKAMLDVINASSLEALMNAKCDH